VRQWITNSVTVGGTQGALVGMLPGILIALAGWLDGTTLNWRLLLATSGVVGGLLRGWLPGYRLATLINQYIGWKRFWQGTGILGGAVGGSILGFLNGWSVIPVILGLVLGAWVGMILGEKFWKISKNLGWERIWGGVSAVMAAGLGWIAAQLAGLAGLNAFGENLTAGLLPYGTSDSISSALLWLMAGGVSGALFGAFSGMIVDMVGRFTKLTR